MSTTTINKLTGADAGRQKDCNKHKENLRKGIEKNANDDALIWRRALLGRYREVRTNSVALATPLSSEDWMLQSMPDASPIKWHLAHITWFFETFLLQPFLPSYKQFDKDFGFFFNSYYQQVGAMHARPERGLLSRPSARKVLEYRQHVDDAMVKLLETVSESRLSDIAALIDLGCAHEEQHQELMQTDILHALSHNAMMPAAYENLAASGHTEDFTGASDWVSFEGGLVETGADNEAGFAFDNEYPKHQYYLNPFEIASRPVTNRDYLEFIEDGGYRDPRPWLSDGWATVQQKNWQAPLYWRQASDGQWLSYTLFGEQALILDAPVRHVSYYEAAAFAAWAGVYLPTETEWEVAANSLGEKEIHNGHFLSHGKPSLFPLQAQGDKLSEEEISASKPSGKKKARLKAMYGHVWEWTSSPYTAYPGYKPASGAIGEYNGKFMSSQMVLRGGSCASPQGHLRATYRNFFPPDARWQFSGFRLAK